MNICLGNMSFIFQDSDNYDIPKDQAPRLFGLMGFAAQIVVFIAGFGLGPIFDLVGRKYVLIVG